jgi:hypothetical protein
MVVVSTPVIGTYHNCLSDNSTFFDQLSPKLYSSLLSHASSLHNEADLFVDFKVEPVRG